jgi:hypothetical protein
MTLRALIPRMQPTTVESKHRQKATKVLLEWVVGEAQSPAKTDEEEEEEPFGAVDALVYRSENEILVPQSPWAVPVASLFGQMNCRRGAAVVADEPRIVVGVVDDGAAAAAAVVVVPEALADNDDIE